MSALVGMRGQVYSDHLFDASGVIASGGAAQLLLPMAKTRSSLIIENISDTNMFLEFGAARATATLTSGTVTSCSVSNTGFGYSRPPKIIFLAGAWDNPNQTTPTYSIQGCPCWQTPSNPAQARCVMSGNAPNQFVGSILIDNPGSGYAYPPYVLLVNDPLDPFGVALPSTTVGIELLPGGSYTANGSVTTTDQISIICATTGKAFTCKYTL